MAGTHIELFLVDGEPGGITTADIASWTGHILTGPRSRLTDLLARDEAHRNGVYLLLGDDAGALDSTRCYIGRTEDLSQRFRDHDRTKDWWDRAILISSRDDSFNEGHWGYIESRLVEIALKAERSSLDDNKQTPQTRKLSEAQQSDAEAFIEQIRLVLPVLGVSVLKTRHSDASALSAPSATGAEPSPTFSLTVPRRHIHARAQVTDGEFLVLEGSTVAGRSVGRPKTAASRRAYDALGARIDKLVADGTIRLVDGHGVLTRDIAFSSPSAAAGVVTGRSCNGRTAWTWGGRTYADWEEVGLAIAPDPVTAVGPTFPPSACPAAAPRPGSAVGPENE